MSASRGNTIAAPISSIALASEYVLTLGSVGGVRPAICPFGCGPSMRRFALELSSFIMTQSSYERPVTGSVSALLTGSSRQRLNGFIEVSQSREGLDGPAPLLLRSRPSPGRFLAH